MRSVLNFGAGALALSVAACAVPHDPPLLTLGSLACDDQPVFEDAQPVPFDRLGGTGAKLGTAGRCVRRNDGPATTYAVFELPATTQPYRVNITSIASGGTLVSPRATIYDAARQPVRVLEPSEFRPTIIGLRAGIRLRGGERWLVMEADHAAVGQPVKLRLGGLRPGEVQVASSTPVFIYVPASSCPDIVRENSATYSLNGRVNVSALPIPTVP